MPTTPNSGSGSRPRITIESLRTLVLVGGALLVAAIAIFLVAGGWTRRMLTKDLPKRLGVDIESQADGVNYTQSRKGKTLFKIHAARAVRMKLGEKTVLHDVVIHLYGEDGSESDTISGSEFEYDPTVGQAEAAGAVEIAVMRPEEKPAVAQLKAGSARSSNARAPHVSADPSRAKDSGRPAEDRQIHVRTSGLIFNQKTGVATTKQRVDFTLQQGNGVSIGATYDSARGQLILDSAVELHVVRPQTQLSGGSMAGPVTVHASHAEFERTEQICRLTQALAEYSGGAAQIVNAEIHFRPDGSVVQVDGSGGLDLRTLTGSHVTAPIGTLAFDENNHPRQGELKGGAQLEMNQPNREMQGFSPTAKFQFDGEGQLRQAHLEQGVQFHSKQSASTATGTSAVVQRTWKSQSADIAFLPVALLKQVAQSADQKAGRSRVEPRTIHGYGGVVVTSESTTAGVVAPSRLAADTVVANLAPGGALSSLLGSGNASFEERTASGAHQSSHSDQLDVQFVPAGSQAISLKNKADARGGSGTSEIATVVETGHVILMQDAPPTHAAKGASSVAQSPVRATANRADYDGKTQLLHLTGSPRIRDGALDLTATRIDFARESGDAVAHGDVRASWIGGGPNAGPPGASLLKNSENNGGAAANGNGPVHAIAAEAELHQATQRVIFRGADQESQKNKSGNQARLWQSANSVSAPLITLNRQKETLDAESGGAANPVMTVLVSNPRGRSAGNSSQKGKHDTPSVIRMRSGDLHYSEGERLALFHRGSLDAVTAQTTGPDGTATVVSNQAEVKLFPAGTHSASSASEPVELSSVASGNPSGNPSIDRMTALGGVSVEWPNRKGTGEKLVYRSEDSTFTLTGTAAVQPRMTDQARGTVTGAALIFHSRDDSVTVEGDGQKTSTETRSPK